MAPGLIAVISALLTAVAVIIAVPVAVLLVEVVAALLKPPRMLVRSGATRRPATAILVPAHNEGEMLLPTIGDIKAQMQPGDRLLVVADNCTDDTAAVAAVAGAEVIERHDSAKIGKGYALDFGCRHLSANPPEILVIVDADCRLGPGGIDVLAVTSAATGRPMQALSLMAAPDGSAISYRVAEFAWRVKNKMRPSGLLALNLPCPLQGTGMAFPWRVIRSAELATGCLVEDMKLGLELAISGSPPLFCPSARVTSLFPTSAQGAASQRQRWEQGHLQMILTMAPRLVRTAAIQRRADLLAMALDLAVPPLALLAMLVVAVCTVSGIAVWLGLPALALIVGIVTAMGFGLAVFMAWLKCGRAILPPRDILSIPGYVIGKFDLYRRLVARRGATLWTRTNRRP